MTAARPASTTLLDGFQHGLPSPVEHGMIHVKERTGWGGRRDRALRSIDDAVQVGPASYQKRVLNEAQLLGPPRSG